METWRRVWRDGFAPRLTTAGLQALCRALEDDDSRLVQGVTTSPPPVKAVHDWPVEAACALGVCGWLGEDLVTVAELEDYFQRLCMAADKLLEEPGACRYFLAWFDDTPREQMRQALLNEVKRALATRTRARQEA